MDSDTFRRLAKDRAHLRENEEAVDKFFRANMDRQPLDENASMERVMREIIERIRIRNSSWVRVNNGNSYQITFSLQNGVRCDDTIHMLSEFGIGEKEGSSIAVVPCTLYRDRNLFKTDDDEESSSAQSVLKETAWNKFIGTVRARMNVAKIVEAVKSDASLTFDFIILVIVASILACFGLVENSTLFLAASMLISPLMGPILAATFGAVIKDHKLQCWGIRNEIFGIFLCIFVGFFFGLIISGLDYISGNQIQGSLTSEMLMRTELHSVIVGILIALPSGAAVAIAVLGDNFGSLVGVAISASLLPPACNTVSQSVFEYTKVSLSYLPSGLVLVIFIHSHDLQRPRIQHSCDWKEILQRSSLRAAGKRRNQLVRNIDKCSLHLLDGFPLLESQRSCACFRWPKTVLETRHKDCQRLQQNDQRRRRKKDARRARRIPSTCLRKFQRCRCWAAKGVALPTYEYLVAAYSAPSPQRVLQQSSKPAWTWWPFGSHEQERTERTTSSPLLVSSFRVHHVALLTQFLHTDLAEARPQLMTTTTRKATKWSSPIRFSCRTGKTSITLSADPHLSKSSPKFPERFNTNRRS